MRNEYEILIEAYDALLSLLHRNAFIADEEKERKWSEGIDDALDQRNRITKLLLALPPPSKIN